MDCDSQGRATLRGDLQDSGPGPVYSSAAEESLEEWCEGTAVGTLKGLAMKLCLVSSPSLDVGEVTARVTSFAGLLGPAVTHLRITHSYTVTHLRITHS